MTFKIGKLMNMLLTNILIDQQYIFINIPEGPPVHTGCLFINIIMNIYNLLQKNMSVK